MNDISEDRQQDEMEEGGQEVLSRDLLATGAFAAMIATDAPDQRLLTEQERKESLSFTMAARPEGDVWLFAYGSLIWNSIIPSIERRPSRIEGWHRSFCLAAISGRGSPENPGLVLALDEGGHCDGVALRLPEENLETELELLWRREMAISAYIPRWLNIFDASGQRFGAALAFTVDRHANVYAGDLSADATVNRLATASGSIGSSAEYLFRTRDGLRALSIRDHALEKLASEVEIALTRER